MRAVGRGDLAALHLPGLGVEVVEGDLFPVDVEPAYYGSSHSAFDLLVSVV